MRTKTSSWHYQQLIVTHMPCVVFVRRRDWSITTSSTSQVILCSKHIKQTSNTPVSCVRFAGRGNSQQVPNQKEMTVVQRNEWEQSCMVERGLGKSLALQHEAMKSLIIHPGPFSAIVAYFALTGAPTIDAIHNLANELKNEATTNDAHLSVNTYTFSEITSMLLIHLKSNIPFRTIWLTFRCSTQHAHKICHEVLYVLDKCSVPKHVRILHSHQLNINTPNNCKTFFGSVACLCDNV